MKKLISVITPAYNEESNIDELARRLGLVFDAEDGYDWEGIVVENGSFDSSYERLVQLNQRDPRFKVVQLARNFRMDGGITAGLESATGDAVVIMASDLQDPPELIHQFLRKWEEGYDLVYQIVTERRGTGPIRMGASPRTSATSDWQIAGSMRACAACASVTGSSVGFSPGPGFARRGSSIRASRAKAASQARTRLAC